MQIMNYEAKDKNGNTVFRGYIEKDGHSLVWDEKGIPVVTTRFYMFVECRYDIARSFQEAFSHYCFSIKNDHFENTKTLNGAFNFDGIMSGSFMSFELDDSDLSEVIASFMQEIEIISRVLSDI